MCVWGHYGVPFRVHPGAQERGRVGRSRQHHFEKIGGLARLGNKKGRLSKPPSEQPGNRIPWTVLGEFHEVLGSNFYFCVIRLRLTHTQVLHSAVHTLRINSQQL